MYYMLRKRHTLVPSQHILAITTFHQPFLTISEVLKWTAISHRRLNTTLQLTDYLWFFGNSNFSITKWITVSLTHDSIWNLETAERFLYDHLLTVHVVLYWNRVLSSTSTRIKVSLCSRVKEYSIHTNQMQRMMRFFFVSIRINKSHVDDSMKGGGKGVTEKMRSLMKLTMLKKKMMDLHPWRSLQVILTNSSFKLKRVNAIRRSFFDGLIFKIISLFEGVVLLSSVCFFFLCYGCHFWLHFVSWNVLFLGVLVCVYIWSLYAITLAY